jgi:hypothetical protein
MREATMSHATDSGAVMAANLAKLALDRGHIFT